MFSCNACTHFSQFSGRHSGFRVFWEMFQVLDGVPVLVGFLMFREKNKNQYAPKTESFRGKIGNREKLARLIFPPTVLVINDPCQSCDLIIRVTKRERSKNENKQSREIH